jgi:hypothetical protein
MPMEKPPSLLWASLSVAFAAASTLPFFNSDGQVPLLTISPTRFDAEDALAILPKPAAWSEMPRSTKPPAIITKWIDDEGQTEEEMRYYILCLLESYDEVKSEATTKAG